MSIDPQPTNPFGWLILLLVSLFLFSVGVQSSWSQHSAPATPQGGRPPVTAQGGDRLGLDSRQMLSIDTVDILILESFPPQIIAQISGYWPDGCSMEPQITTTRDGDMITVRITRDLPSDALCTQMITPVNLDLPLTDAVKTDGVVRSGTYVIDVNGVITTTTF